MTAKAPQTLAAVAVVAALAVIARPWRAGHPAPPPATAARGQRAAVDTLKPPPPAPGRTLTRPADPGLRYDSLAYAADPGAVVAGRVPGLSVIDSVELGVRGGARTVALLVQAGPDSTHPTRHVYLASGPAGRRTIRSTHLVGIGSFPRGRQGFGAVDVDGDGVREPYVVASSGGTGGYEIDVSVLRPDWSGTYDYEYGGEWSDLSSRRGDFTSASGSPGIRTRRWAERLAGSLADSIDEYARDPEVVRANAERDEWLAEHGRGFHDGPLHPRWKRGLARWLANDCQASDGTLRWASTFNGVVLGVDSVRRRHFVLRVPDNEYEPARGIVVGRRYVWLGNTAKAGGGFGLVVYDRRRERMGTIPIPELTARDWTCAGPVCGSQWLSLRGGRIYAGTTALTLPDSIDARTELAGATSCGSG
jgi:hypothetical protein